MLICVRTYALETYAHLSLPHHCAETLHPGVRYAENWQQVIAKRGTPLTIAGGATAHGNRIGSL